jgi:hypothetical protein
MGARVGQWASRLPGEGGGRVSDRRSDRDTAISGKRSHRDTITRITNGDGIKTYLWEHAICASSRSQGWAGPLFGCEGKKCRSGRQARSSPSVRLSQAKVLARCPNRRNTAVP